MANRSKCLTMVLVTLFCFVSLGKAADEGLVAYYSFDEGEGNALHDLSGKGNDGVIHGAKWVEGMYGKALEFDGVDDYVSIGNKDLLKFGSATDFSIELLVKPKGDSLAFIIGDEYGVKPYPGYGIFYRYKDEFNFVLADGPNFMNVPAGSMGSSLNKWTYLVAVADRDGDGYLYINGDLVSSANVSKIGNINHDYNFEIGRRNTGTQYFKGTIDEVHIYNRILTKEEIFQNIISKVETKIAQLNKEKIKTTPIEKIVASAKDILKKKGYNAAIKQVQEALSKVDEMWNTFQNYHNLKKEVEAKFEQLKKEGLDVSSMEDSLSKAKNALGEKGDIKLAQQLVSEAKLKTDKTWLVYQDIEKARKVVTEVKEIGCDTSDAEDKIKDAVNALNKRNYDLVKQYAQEAISRAGKADCGKFSIRDLTALADRYDGRKIKVSGEVRNIEIMYGEGYKFTVDDGTGSMVVEYEGSMQGIDEGDNIGVKGVFSLNKKVVVADKVEKSLLKALIDKLF